VLLLKDGCMLHAGTPCSRSLHLRQQQLLEKLEPPWEAVHVSAQGPNGAGNTCWSAAGACKLAQGNVSLRSSQGGTTSASQGATRS
jgi:hypothetical protein